MKSGGLRLLIDSDSRSAVHLVITLSCVCFGALCVCGRCGAPGNQDLVI